MTPDNTSPPTSNHPATPPALGVPGPPLTTDSLTLRLWTRAELDAARAGRSLPHFAEDFPAEGDREIARFVAQHGDITDEYGHRLLVELPGALVIGSASLLWPPKTDGSVEIGFGVVPSRRRRGHAEAAARALVEHAFTRSDVTMVVAGAETDNTASHRVLTNAGFERTGTDVRFARTRPGTG